MPELTGLLSNGSLVIVALVSFGIVVSTLTMTVGGFALIDPLLQPLMTMFNAPR